MDSLKKKTLQGLKWSTFQKFIDYAIQLAIGIILARLLTPEDFGLISIVLSITAISQIFIDSGFGSSIVQAKEFKKTDINSIMTFNVIVGCGFTIIIFTLSPFIASFFNDDRLINIAKSLSSIYFIQSFGIAPKNFLIRKIDFKKQFFIELTAVILAGTIGIIIAYLDFGYWSLIVRRIVYVLIFSIGYILFTGIKPSFRLDFGVLKNHWRYSWFIFSNSLLTTLKNNFDTAVIGKMLSSTTLGLYSRGKYYAYLPIQFIYTALNKPLFTSFSKIQDNEDKFCYNYNQVIKKISFLVFFIMFSIFLTANELVLIILGTKWIQVIPYLKLFALWAIFEEFILFNSDIFNAKGYPRINIYITLLSSILSIVFVIFAYFFLNKNNLSINIAYALFITNVISYTTQNFFLSKILKRSIFESLLVFWEELLLCLFSLLLAYLLLSQFKLSPPILSIILKSATFTSIIIITSFIFKIELLDYLKGVFIKQNK